jgi:hypothetical protein
MACLSPLNLSGLRVTAERECTAAAIDQHPLKSSQRKRDRVDVVTRYVCTLCDEEYDTREEAEVCCEDEDDEDTPGVVLKTNCPVCNRTHGDEHSAAECCLWKDTDPPQRWRIAAMVEGGKSWTEAIEEVTGQKLNPYN